MHITLSITTGDSPYLSNDSSLAIVLPNCVTIVHSATRDTPSQYLDIMLDNIEKCSYGRKDHCAINLELANPGRGNYVGDGLTKKADKFSMVFGNEEQANKFLAAIERVAPHL